MTGENKKRVKKSFPLTFISNFSTYPHLLTTIVLNPPSLCLFFFLSLQHFTIFLSRLKIDANIQEHFKSPTKIYKRKKRQTRENDIYPLALIYGRNTAECGFILSVKQQQEEVLRRLIKLYKINLKVRI